ncbi:NAD(P)-dependent oxidoreductase [Pseudodesulfovibrio sp. zrk46]|uniref:NAD-dependent epimerase/dehydratase family protein n=1 Tax=Pseudodesulfovibrio sp. zrk46 TaxID=2725288 RepID=UPI001449E2F0|nr:NAD(P)-dependent oxidoreductase [Pseudodesulfovibrio sp. zrk46]QJB55736.1 NAD(P)-dependent oxidoreductase [Pseudodesulfovibrio sp. zrk46]
MSLFDNTKILVTGGTGFIGSNLLAALLQTGAQLRSTIHNTPAVIDDPRIEYIHADLTNADDCERCCKDMDIVVHCAAVTSGAAEIEHKPLIHLTPNVIMNTQLMEAAHYSGVSQFVFISSNIVYPLTDHAVVEEEAVGDFFEKYFIVGWMKMFAEKMCEMYATKIKNPMSTLVLRPANLYGPMDDFEWETSHVLPALIRKIVERMDPVPVWGDGKDIKDFVYIDDFIEGMLLATKQQKANEAPGAFDVFNLSSGEGYCLRDLIDIIIEEDGYDGAEVAYDSTKPTMIPKRIVNSDKAANILGWKPKTDIRTGLAKTIEWYRSQL